MAVLNVNFSSSISFVDNVNKLILIDTTDYTDNDEAINNKTWIITHSNGEIEIFSRPDGVLEYTLQKDEALIIKLAINYTPENEFIGYNKVKNILANPILYEALYDMRKELVETYTEKCNDIIFNKLLNELSIITLLEESSRTLISTDIVATQKALDLANLQIKNFQSIS